MTPEQLQHFHQELETIRQELLDTLDAGPDTGPVALDQSRFGRLARMDALQGQAMAQEVRRRKEVRLQQVQSALARIASGTYGACIVCEEEIGQRRLESDPAFPRCLACASRP